MVAYGTHIAAFNGFRPHLHPFGDSTTDGVGAATVAAWREGLYNSAFAAGTPFFFIGTQSNGGAGGGLNQDPWHEGIDGITSESLATLLPRMQTNQWGVADIVQWLAGTNSLDPAIGNESPATVATTTSSALDTIWAARTTARFQIVLCEVFRRLDAVDTNVQAFNALLPGVIAGKSYKANITLIHTYDSAPADPAYYESSPAVSPVHFNDAGYNLAAARLWASYPAILTKARG